MTASPTLHRFLAIAPMTTSQLFSHVQTELERAGYPEIRYSPDGEDFVWAHPETPSPIAIVAHLDMVGAPPKKFQIRGGIVRNKKHATLGADDRAGVTTILTLLDRGYRPSVYFTTGEESGGIGAKKLARYTPPDSLRLLIEIDRAGWNDYVTYACESGRLNSYVERFGFERQQGSYTDISTLQEEWGMAGVNLSAGYYGQHGGNERLVIPQLDHTIDRVAAMLDSPPQSRIDFERRPEPKIQSYSGFSYGSDSWIPPTPEKLAKTDNYRSNRRIPLQSMQRCAICGAWKPEQEIGCITRACNDCKPKLSTIFGS